MGNRQFWKLTIILLSLLLAVPVFANTGDEDVLSVTPLLSQDGVVPGGTLGIALAVDMAEHWHVYAPVDDEASFTIPIEPSISAEGIDADKLNWIYPEAELLSVAGVDEKAAVYGGSFLLRTEVAVPSDAAENLKLKGSVYYQACDDQRCLIPQELEFSLSVPVVNNATAINLTNAGVFTPQESMQTEVTEVEEDDEVAALVAERGLIITFILIFLGGLALNLTPCVYPLIPITISYFGGMDVGRTKTFWNALAYVLGIAVTYSVLGVVAALGGGLFGALLTHPAVLIGIAIILVGLSLSMFGLYEFRLPSGLMTAAGQAKSGIFGSLFMGLTLGIIAAPCVGPFVIGLLTYVATLQNVLMGFLMFFTLAMGLGLPYLFLAMFSSRITSLPRSGAWMVGVRIIFGLILVAMAIYFLMPLLGDWGSLALSIFLLGSGVFLIVIDKNGNDAKGFLAVKQILAIVMIIAATWLALPNESAAAEKIDWLTPEDEAALESMLDSGKPVMIDFYADWCIPCKEMDKFTFSDPRVVEYSRQMTMIKIDMTQFDGEFESILQQRFKVKGVPTYLFMTKDRRELPKLRLTGFEKADPFLDRLKAGTSQ